MSTHYLTLRLMFACLTLALMLTLSTSARGQPADELIAKLLELSKEKKKLSPEKTDDELRQLLIRRYNVAVEELTLRCQDFKKHLATKATVVEAGKQLLQSELELQKTPADRLKVLQKTNDLLKWYEKLLEDAVKKGLLPRADLLSLQFRRLTIEIDIVKTKQSIDKRPE